MEEIRLRFPPSPTGYLHIGGARTALYNWLYAKQTGGKLVLRIEDTDLERSTEESVQGIVEGLDWLGIDFDEGPYLQSDFARQHAEAAEKLLETGAAYKCFCSKEELEAKREAAVAAKQSHVGYDGTCRHLSSEEVAEKEAANIPYVIRFRVPERKGQIAYDDLIMGRIAANYDQLEDFVIVRSNGAPLYLLCNVVDDIRDRISHVVRGQDHMTNTLKQILLYEALGAPLPRFGHMPLTLDNKKAKISKRKHGEIVAVQFYRDAGFIPWAFNNFLALLGWSAGDDKEFFTKEELIAAFSFDRVNKSSAVFNYKKDDPKFFTDPKAIAINEHYLRTMDIEELGQMVQKELEEAKLWRPEYAAEKRAWYLHTIDMLRERFHTLKDFATLGRAYFADDYTIDEKPLKKNILKHEGLKEWFPQLAERYAALAAEAWTAEKAEEIAKEYAEELQIKPGILINGMRTIVTGQAAGPSIFDILVQIGRDKVVERLRTIDALYK